MCNIDGFLFEDETVVEIAKKEEVAVNYLKEHTPLSEVESVYQLYTKLLDQKLFVTPVGMRFLTELQSILYNSEVPKETIPPIPAVWYQTLELAKKSQGIEIDEKQQETKEEISSGTEKAEEPSKIQIEDTAVLKNEEKAKKKSAKKDTATTKEMNKYKKSYHVALFFAIVFGLSVVGMFIISELSGNNVNIINYRNELINEYSTWETELKEWEAELKAREEALGITAQ